MSRSSLRVLGLPRPAVLALYSLALVGCSSLRQPDPGKNTFALRLPPPDATAAHPVAPEPLRTQPMRAAATCADTAFLYRVAPSKVEPDYYNGFIVAPTQMLSAELARRIEAARVFPAVVEPGGLADYGFTLETTLQDLHADYTDRRSPKAVVAIKVFLLREEAAGSTVRLQRTYTESEPITADSPEALVAGWERACARIFDALSNDLRATFAATTSVCPAGRPRHPDAPSRPAAAGMIESRTTRSIAGV
jgi:ABC-type uncharacterized transport system auxiliary subunit